MSSDGLQRMTLARAKRLALLGALVLWVVCPLAIGGWIALAVHQADRHTSPAMYVLLVVWAVVDLALLAAGFAALLGGIFFWWRSHAATRPTGPNLTRRAGDGSSARQELLRQLREELRDEPDASNVTDPPEAAGPHAGGVGANGGAVRPVDSEPPHTPR